MQAVCRPQYRDILHTRRKLVPVMGVGNVPNAAQKVSCTGANEGPSQISAVGDIAHCTMGQPCTTSARVGFG